MEELKFLHELRKFLIEQWKIFNLPGSPSQVTYRMGQVPKGRSQERSRPVALWFSENPEEPQVVTKWVSNSTFSPLVVTEYERKKQLYETQGFRFIPKPLACPEILGIPVLIEEAVQGRSLAHQLISRSLEKHTLEEVYKKAEEILKKLQDPLRSVTKEEVLQELEPHSENAEFGQFFTRFPFDSVPGSGRTLLVGDFAPQHVLVGKTGTYLIDLEFAQESVMAFLDPLAFVHSLFCLTVYPASPENFGQAIQLFKEHLLEEKSVSGKLANQFLSARGIAKGKEAWYWLLFFIHEAAFQRVISDMFSSPNRRECEGFISLLLKHLELSPLHP